MAFDPQHESNKPMTLQHLLEDIAQQEIPDDMNLWNDIQEQLEKPAPRRSRTMMGAIRLAAILLLVMIPAVAYGFYQTFDGGDPGLEQVEEAGLVTEIGATQTQGDVEITLDWAYADAHRIAVAYTITQPDDAPQVSFSGQSRLLDQQGNVLTNNSFGGGGGDGSIFEGTTNFDTDFINGTPDTLDLRLELVLAQSTEMISGGGFGGGGGGGGTAPPDAPPPMPEGFEPFGTFIFDFTVPYIPATIIEPMETITVNETPIRLESVSAAPSMTLIRFCYPPLDITKDFQLDLILTVDGTKRNSFGHETLPNNQGETCTTVRVPAPYNESESEWTLTIRRIQSMPVFTEAELEATFAELGYPQIDVTVYEGGGFGIETSDVPEGTDLQTVIEAGLRPFREVIEGPWVFTIRMP